MKTQSRYLNMIPILISPHPVLHLHPGPVRRLTASLRQALGALCCLVVVAGLHSNTAISAPLAIPSNGSDGALIVTTSTNIDLSKAVGGTWSDDNSANPGNAGKGIYDANKWAVVFKYSSVSIASGATVTFSNHRTRAPVVWLVSGNVTIDGTLDLSGGSANADIFLVPEPGPGGFRGGAAENSSYGLGQGSGFGPGGYYADHGAYSTYHTYGNPQIVPLIGGSGGSGNGGYTGNGGGGAILIAASSNITVNGNCRANSGPGGGTYYASGGAIRLVADQILGTGYVQAVSSLYPGRIRLEANFLSPTVTSYPPTVAAPPTPLVIWPAGNASTVRVISIAGQAAPLDPAAPINAASELTIATTNVVSIVVETANFPTNGTLNVYIKPRNSPQSILPATVTSGDVNLATWRVTTTLLPAYSVIQVRAISN